MVLVELIVRLGLVALALPAMLAGQAVLRGVVHDPQHRPVAGAEILVRGAAASSEQKTARSDAEGAFELDQLADGDYRITVSAAGFASIEQVAAVKAGKKDLLHFELKVAEMNDTVTVSGAPDKLHPQTATPMALVGAQEIAETPGAGQTNSLAMITDFTPGAYMVHDMLHMRGGHQVNWFVDGIPLVNTNIAANVAPLVNPKDVEELEIERGGYSSDSGDRTYGFLNVVTPSGFESNNEINLVLSAGNFYSTDDKLSVASHTQRFAYYASVDANRSELGLSTPISEVIHDQTSGAGGLVSLLYNVTSKDQLRWVVSVRENHYQIPNDFDLQASGIRDLDLEQDYLAGFHWTHSFSDGVLFTLSPYYHYNSAHFLGGPNDNPFILDDNDRSNYLGGRAVLQVQKGKHNARAGLDIWAQHDNAFFGLTANPGGGVFQQTERHWANSDAAFLEEQYKANSWLTLNLGLRLTHYGGLVNENAADPRLGAAIRIPRLNWTLRGYYAYYYQPPPLDSLTGPSLAFAQTQGYNFVPLSGERDIQHDIGLTIPLGGWAIEADNFHTSARNFLDHDVIGNSGVFVPLSDLGAIISGTEVTVRSPQLFHRAHLRVAYSNQIAQGIGPITGGLLEFAPPGNFLLDHDQRNTATAVLTTTLPANAWFTPAYQFGSGFLNGDGPAHLPPHSTFDLSIGKRFGERLTISANAVNIANSRYLLDTSNTFGGTHYINSRQIYGELRYRFHF